MIAKSCTSVGGEFVVTVDGEPGEVRFPVGTPIVANGVLLRNAVANLPNWLKTLATPGKFKAPDTGEIIEVLPSPSRLTLTTDDDGKVTGVRFDQ